MLKTAKWIVFVSVIGMVISISLGALGAHWLKSYLTESAMESFHTGVRYLMLESVALLAIMALFRGDQKVLRPAWLILIGTLFFSLSIFGLVYSKHVLEEAWSLLGPVTPLGGSFQIIGWIWLAVLVFKSTPTFFSNKL